MKQWAAVNTTSSDTRAPPQASFPWCFSLASQGHGEGDSAWAPSLPKVPQAETDYTICLLAKCSLHARTCAKRFPCTIRSSQQPLKLNFVSLVTKVQRG